MSGGKGGGASKVNTDPWKPQQPGLIKGYGEAGRLYDQGPAEFFPGKTFADLNSVQRDALTSMLGRSGGSGGESAMRDYITSTLGRSGPDLSGTYSALDRLQNPQSGMRPIGLEGASQFAGNMSVGASPGANPLSIRTLSDTASGKMLNANPYLDQTFNRASENVRNQFNETVIPGINATFGAGGRTGSDLHADAFGRAGRELGGTLGNLATDIYGGNYATERGRQLDAASNLDTIGRGWSADDLARAGLRSADDLSRRGLAADLYGRDADRALTGELGRGELALGAAGTMGDLARVAGAERATAAGMVPQSSALDWAGLDRAKGVGDVLQGQDTLGINEAIARHDFGQNNDWDALSKYMAALSGNPGGTSTTSMPSGNPITGAVGGGLTGGVLGAGLGGLASNSGLLAGLLGEGGAAGFGAMLGPWGAGLGALSGLLWS